MVTLYAMAYSYVLGVQTCFTERMREVASEKEEVAQSVEGAREFEVDVAPSA